MNVQFRHLPKAQDGIFSYIACSTFCTLTLHNFSSCINLYTCIIKIHKDAFYNIKVCRSNAEQVSVTRNKDWGCFLSSRATENAAIIQDANNRTHHFTLIKDVELRP